MRIISQFYVSIYDEVCVQTARTCKQERNYRIYDVAEISRENEKYILYGEYRVKL